MSEAETPEQVCQAWQGWSRQVEETGHATQGVLALRGGQKVTSLWQAHQGVALPSWVEVGISTKILSLFKGNKL